MALIPSLLKKLTRTFKGILPRSLPGLRSINRVTGMWKSLTGGSKPVDIVETLKASDVDAIAENIGQTVFTAQRMLNTEPFVVDFDKNRLLPRNLQVSGRLKSAKNYWQFYQADLFDANGNFVRRKWFSTYTDTLKAFSETEEDLIEKFKAGDSEGPLSIANLTLHHVVHQRGAPRLEVDPR